MRRRPSTATAKCQKLRCRTSNWTPRSARFLRNSSFASFIPLLRLLRHCRESHADPVALDPDHPALTDRGVLRHHQAEARRYESRILDVDRGTLRRDISNDTAHDRSARRYVGCLVDLGPLILALFFHGLPP